MNCKNFVLVIIFSSFLCLVVACAAKKLNTDPDNRGALVFDAGGEMEQPVPTPVPTPIPEPTPIPVPAPAPVDDVPEGLVGICIQAQSPLNVCKTDIGYEPPQQRVADGMVYMAITPGNHQVNCRDTDGRVAVDNGVVKYPLWVNGVELTVVRSHVAGGMYYFYVFEDDGRISPTKP